MICFGGIVKFKNKFSSIQPATNKNQLIVGIVLVLLFSSLGGLLFQNQNQSTKVLVVTEDVAAGVSVEDVDFSFLELSGQVPEQVVTSVPTSGFLARSFQAGEIVQSNDVSVDQIPSSLVSASLAPSAIPAFVRIGDVIELWSSISGELAIRIGMAEIIQISAMENTEDLTLTFRVMPALVPLVLGTGPDLKVVASG
jgi:uncharacterized protein YkvS